MTYGVGLFAELNVVAPLVVEVVDASVTVFDAICARSPDSSRTHPVEMNGESYRLKQRRRVSAMLFSD